MSLGSEVGLILSIFCFIKVWSILEAVSLRHLTRSLNLCLLLYLRSGCKCSQTDLSRRESLWEPVGSSGCTPASSAASIRQSSAECRSGESIGSWLLLIGFLFLCNDLLFFFFRYLLFWRRWRGYILIWIFFSCYHIPFLFLIIVHSRGCSTRVCLLSPNQQPNDVIDDTEESVVKQVLPAIVVGLRCSLAWRGEGLRVEIFLLISLFRFFLKFRSILCNFLVWLLRILDNRF